MRLGDRVLFYHSSTDPPAVAGTAVVARQAYPDHTALDKRDHHYDPKATTENPIWEMVDLRLEQISHGARADRNVAGGMPELAGMELLRERFATVGATGQAARVRRGAGVGGRGGRWAGSAGEEVAGQEGGCEESGGEESVNEVGGKVAEAGNDVRRAK